MQSTDIREESFPAPAREASGLVNGIPTEVTSTSFSDKILITISQEGRLSQWVKPLADHCIVLLAKIPPRFKVLWQAPPGVWWRWPCLA